MVGVVPLLLLRQKDFPKGKISLKSPKQITTQSVGAFFFSSGVRMREQKRIKVTERDFQSSLLSLTGRNKKLLAMVLVSVGGKKSDSSRKSCK